MSKFLLSLILLLITACEDATSPTQADSSENTSWVFVANEGTFGASNGSISMIGDTGDIYHTEAIGDVVQSLEVYGDKLIVLVNGSHKIKIYDITSEGLAMPGIEVSTEGSSPREMVIVNDMLYFTNWYTSDVKIFNLYTYNIEGSIPVGTMPEGIIYDGAHIWVANSGGTTISKINIENQLVEENIEVGQGPQNFVIHDNDIYVSRTYYSDDWTMIYHGASKIESPSSLMKEYGTGAVCTGTLVSYNQKVYRSFEDKIASINNETLNINQSDEIGSFGYDVYHVEVIDDNTWFAITDYSTFNQVKVLDSNGSEVASYDVGINPGDFSIWPNISDGTRGAGAPPEGF